MRIGLVIFAGCVLLVLIAVPLLFGPASDDAADNADLAAADVPEDAYATSATPLRVGQDVWNDDLWPEPEYPEEPEPPPEPEPVAQPAQQPRQQNPRKQQPPPAPKIDARSLVGTKWRIDNKYVVSLKSGGRLSVDGAIPGVSVPGTWKVTQTQLTASAMGQSFNIPIKDGKIVTGRTSVQRVN